VVGKAKVPLRAMFESDGMAIGGWYDVLVPDSDSGEYSTDSDDGNVNVVGEIEVDMMLASIPEQENMEREEEKKKKESNSHPHEINGSDANDVTVKYVNAENVSGPFDTMMNDKKEEEVHFDEEHLELETSIMSDDSLEEEEIEFVEDMDRRMPPTTVQPFDAISEYPEEIETEQQRWGSIEVSIIHGMHLSTLCAEKPNEPLSPQLYVSYRWDITSPVISTPLVRPHGTQLTWEHTRLVSVPKTDLTVQKLTKRVVLCSVWERPPWTRAMFTTNEEGDNNDPASMRLASDGAAAGSTLPGDRLIGICRIPLSSLSRSMPVIDGWYNVYSSEQTPSGQLRVRIAPDLNVSEVLTADSIKGSGNNNLGTENENININNSSIGNASANHIAQSLHGEREVETATVSSIIAYEHKYAEGDATSSTLSILKNIVKDLDDVQFRLRTNVGSRVHGNHTMTKQNKTMHDQAAQNTNNSSANSSSVNNSSANSSSASNISASNISANPGGTVNASMSNYYSNTPVVAASLPPFAGMVPPHLRVTTGMSNSPSNWLTQRQQMPAVGTRKRFVSGASE